MVRRGSVRLMRLILVLGALAGTTVGPHAQLPSSLLDTLAQGRRTRVELRDGGRVFGRVQLVRSDLLTLTVIE
jgi:hypothetical protein